MSSVLSHSRGLEPKRCSCSSSAGAELASTDDVPVDPDHLMEDGEETDATEPISKEEAAERLLVRSESDGLMMMMEQDVTLMCVFVLQETEKIIAELNETWEEKLRKTESIRLER